MGCLDKLHEITCNIMCKFGYIHHIACSSDINPDISFDTRTLPDLRIFASTLLFIKKNKHINQQGVGKSDF